MQKFDEVNFKILIADENIKYRDNLAARLRMLGFTIELATGGFHLLHMLEKHWDYDLIILHEDMEDMSALEMISLVRTNKTRTELPIVFISVTGTEDDIREMILNGANDYILKSPNLQPIIDRVSKYANLTK